MKAFVIYFNFMSKIKKLNLFSSNVIFNNHIMFKVKREYYPSGKLEAEWFEEINYIKKGNYIKEGEYKSYHKNGQLKLICNYVNNKKEGMYKSYYKNGQLKVICNYVNNMIEGEYKSYYKNGQLEKFENYINGKMRGECKYYNFSGKLYEITHYIYEEKEDLVHYRDGKIDYVTNYVNVSE